MNGIAYIYESTEYLDEVMRIAVKHRAGYATDDLFREINLKVFDKSRYTTKAAKIYSEALKKLINDGTIEIVGNSIRCLS
jgi:gamma-glutamyltranspeptidase